MQAQRIDIAVYDTVTGLKVGGGSMFSGRPVEAVTIKRRADDAIDEAALVAAYSSLDPAGVRRIGRTDALKQAEAIADATRFIASVEVRPIPASEYDVVRMCFRR